MISPTTFILASLFSLVIPILIFLLWDYRMRDVFWSRRGARYRRLSTDRMLKKINRP